MVNLKKLRDAEGLSQKSLANQLGLTQQSIHSYENDIYEPDIKTLKLIAKFFNTSIDYLLENTDIRKKIEKLDKYDLNPEEAHLVDKYRVLSAKGRNSLQLILDSLD